MPETRQSKRDGIEQWLKKQLGGEVDVCSDKGRGVWIFRVTIANLETEPELHVWNRTLDQFNLREMVEHLNQQEVPKRLRERPSTRLLYGTGSAGKVVQEIGNG